MVKIVLLSIILIVFLMYDHILIKMYEFLHIDVDDEE